MLFQLIIHQFFCSISKRNEFNKGKGRDLWKFNNSLISTTDFVEEMKQLKILNNNNCRNQNKLTK